MKKIYITLILLISLAYNGFCQYFQGGFSLGTDDTLIFKMRPIGGDITTQISYIETSFRFLTAQKPTLSTSTPISNIAFFGSGLNIQSFPPNYVEGNYTYIKFVHNTGSLASKTYTAGTEYEIFRVKLSQTPVEADSIEMSSNLTSGNYVFGVVDGAGVQIDPGSGDQLYGTDFFKDGDGQYVPLIPHTTPVRFLNFSATKKADAALLTWQIENESSTTVSYVVERSLNGVDFTSVTTIPAKNNGATSNTYEISDNNLSSLRTSGVIYYRIKQIDADGKFVYTTIKSVRLSDNQTILNVYPNPVRTTTNLSFDLSDNQIVTISIADASGKEINKFQHQGIKGLNTKLIDMNSLSAGTYTLKVQSATDIKTIPVIKTN